MLNYIKGYIKNLTNKGVGWFTLLDDHSIVSPLAHVNRGVKLIESTVGRYTYIGQNTWAMHADIGSFCSIAGNIRVGLATHTLDKLSTSPLFTEAQNATGHSWTNVKTDNPWKRVRIGNDVWIGTRCIIMGGVTIGDGAVIGAGAIVTKDVPPYAIVAGVPAKIVKYRFPEDVRAKLMELKWWEMPDSELKNHIGLFQTKEIDMDLINSLTTSRCAAMRGGGKRLRNRDLQSFTNKKAA